MARFTDTKQPKTPTAPRPDNFRTYLAVRRSRFVPREAPLRDASNSPAASPTRALRIATIQSNHLKTNLSLTSIAFGCEKTLQSMKHFYMQLIYLKWLSGME